MSGSLNENLPDARGELRRPFTDGDRIALASTALAILRLPGPLQQFSNACDMLDILAGEPCGRAGYILGQAHAVLDVYSGFRPGGHNAYDWRETDEDHDEVEKLVAEALEKRRELIDEGTFTPLQGHQ
jgi:hypothetical protein